MIAPVSQGWAEVGQGGVEHNTLVLSSVGKGLGKADGLGGIEQKGLTAPRVTFNIPESLPSRVAAEGEDGAALVAAEDAAEVILV